MTRFSHRPVTKNVVRTVYRDFESELVTPDTGQTITNPDTEDNIQNPDTSENITVP